MNNKITKKRKKVMRRFINTTEQILQEESYDNLSVRKIAGESNYTCATLYYYFEDLNDLMTYVSLKYLMGFITQQKQIENNYIDSIDKFIKTWKIFINHAFKNPNQYYLLFYGDYSIKLLKIIEIYKELYPANNRFSLNDLPIVRTPENKFILPHLELCIAHGHIKAHKKNIIIEGIEMIFKGMLQKIIKQKNINSREMKEQMMEYIKLFLRSYKTPIGMSFNLKK
ncbi:MAG: TetR/AcrR family transcriptional regulator [Halothermotrichaceae bacterium]